MANSPSFQEHHVIPQGKVFAEHKVIELLSDKKLFGLQDAANKLNLPADAATAAELGLSPHTGGPLKSYEEGVQRTLDAIRDSEDFKAATAGDKAALGRVASKVELLRDVVKAGLINGEIQTNAFSDPNATAAEKATARELADKANKEFFDPEPGKSRLDKLQEYASDERVKAQIERFSKMAPDKQAWAAVLDENFPDRAAIMDKLGVAGAKGVALEGLLKGLKIVGVTGLVVDTLISSAQAAEQAGAGKVDDAIETMSKLAARIYVGAEAAAGGAAAMAALFGVTGPGAIIAGIIGGVAGGIAGTVAGEKAVDVIWDGVDKISKLLNGEPPKEVPPAPPGVPVSEGKAPPPTEYPTVAVDPKLAGVYREGPPPQKTPDPPKENSGGGGDGSSGSGTGGTGTETSGGGNGGGRDRPDKHITREFDTPTTHITEYSDGSKDQTYKDGRTSYFSSSGDYYGYNDGIDLRDAYSTGNSRRSDGSAAPLPSSGSGGGGGGETGFGDSVADATTGTGGLYPVALDLDGDGKIQLVGLRESGVTFDRDGDGYKERTAWVGPKDGFLVADLNGDGKIEGKELLLSQLTAAEDTDLEALAAVFDSTRDGVIDAKDKEFGKLRVWQDLNQDGVADAGELKSLAEAGLRSIDVDPKKGWHDTSAMTAAEKARWSLAAQQDAKTEGLDLADGNVLHGVTNGAKADGKAILVADLGLAATAKGLKTSEQQDGTAIHDLEAGGRVAIGSDGSNTIVAGTGDLSAFGLGGDDRITGGAGRDRLEGGLGKDTLTGGAGDDLLRGGAGADALDGGAGTDLADYSSSFVNITVDLTTGKGQGGEAEGDTLKAIETVWGGRGNDTLRGGAGANSLYGDAGDDRLSGEAGADVLLGGDGRDTLDGGAGSDTLLGGGGDDNLSGGDGDDLLTGGAGKDLHNGGIGFDFASFLSSPVGVSVDLQTGKGTGGDAQGDSFTGIEGLIGSDAADTLAGNEAANRLIGNAGDDQLYGRAGGDLLEGGSGNDSLQGQDGDDRLIGGVGADRLDGGADTDTADYSAAMAGVVVSLAAGRASGPIDLAAAARFDAAWYLKQNPDVAEAGMDAAAHYASNGWKEGRDPNPWFDTSWYLKTYADIAKAGVNPFEHYRLSGQGEGRAPAERFAAEADVLLGIENVVGGQGDDQLQGDGGTNVLVGGKGADTLEGQGGNDALSGGAGDDSLDGGAGADVLDGGQGTDTASYAASAAGVSIDLGRGVGGYGDAQGDRLTGIENLLGSAQADFLLGSSVANVLSGGAGDDTLVGYAGADTLDGGAETDTADYSTSKAGVNIDLATGKGTGGDAQGDVLRGIEIVLGSNTADTLAGSAAADRLMGAYGDDQLYGRAGSDILEGGAGDDALLGQDGDDVLRGGAGKDRLDGGDGRDVADYSLSWSAVTVDLATGKGSYGAADGDTLAGIEVVWGSAHNDVLKGGGSGDTLIGGAGNDTLEGGDGADQLVGGEGWDVALYTADKAGVSVDLASGWGSRGEAQGDRLSGIEEVHGGAGRDTLIGAGGRNVLSGGDGDDLIVGGGGSDTLSGGGGLDQVSYANAGSAVHVDLSSGWGAWGDAEGDQVAGFENLEGSAHGDTLLGSGLANTIRGGDGDDTIDGRGGDDRIIGGMGADTITGGGGKDVIAYSTVAESTPWSRDRILGHTEVNASADHDWIDVSAIDANVDKAGHQGWIFDGVFENSDRWAKVHEDGNSAGHLWATREGDDTVVWGDTNGDETADFAITIVGRRYGGMDAGDFVGARAAGPSYSPVALDLDRDGKLDVRPLDTDDPTGPGFDWDGDGVPEPTAWVGPKDGFLAIDLGRDGAAGPDGVIDQAQELSFRDHASGAVTDLEGLRLAFDSNGDGVLSAADARWSEFRIWQDLNQDGKADAGELRSLDDWGIDHIALTPDPAGSATFPDGSAVTGTSRFGWKDGTAGLAGDLTLRAAGIEDALL